MIDYHKEFDKEIQKIDKLIQTPNLMRDFAVHTLEKIMNQNTLYGRGEISNAIDALKNISDRSISDNYTTIYGHCCVLSVSTLSATIEKYFINFGNAHPDKINTSSKGKEIKFTLAELASADFNVKPNIMHWIKDKDSGISFQDLQSTKRAFEEYLDKKIRVNENYEKLIIFYQQCRHNIVHAAATVDELFIQRLKPRGANLKAYKTGDKIVLDNRDWDNIKSSFSELVKAIIPLSPR